MAPKVKEEEVMTNATHILDDNIKTFNNMSDELNLHHAGKFVLIYNSNFVASYDSFDNAAKDAVKKFGRGPYLIRQVGAPTEMPMPASVAYRPIHAHN